MARNNKELASELKGQRGARFCLCDFHVHSPASYDVAGKKYLNEFERTRLAKWLGKVPKNLIEYQNDIIKVYPPSDYLKALTERRDEVVKHLGIGEYNKWATVAITDHNVCKYSTEVSKLAWEARKKNKIIVLPGIELDVNFKDASGESVGIHVLCIFQPNVSSSDIRLAISNASGTNWKEGDSLLEVESLQKFITNMRGNDDYPAMVVAAHVWSTKGMQKEVKKLLSAKDAAIVQLEAEVEDAEGVEKERLEVKLKELNEGREEEGTIDAIVLKSIGLCGFDALQVRGKSDEKHYRRLHRFREEHGRSVPVVSSDAHTYTKVFCVNEKLYPQLKIDGSFNKLDEYGFFEEVRDRAIRCGETRFNYTYGGEVTHWIEGIEIVRDSEHATNFWPDSGGLVLPLSRNLNCLIGGRGSGKSAAIEALSFLLEPGAVLEQGKRQPAKWDSWYRRAKSTLDGCKLRLCWKAFGNAPEEYRKGVFVTRYFDINNKHEQPTITNIEGETIISPEMPRVQLYRFHDIEKSAEAKGLRGLIDEIAGGVDYIEEEISSIKKDLSKNASEISMVAKDINDLVKDGSLLRKYARIKIDYENANKKEVKEHFEKLDAVGEAGKYINKIRDQWVSISEKYSEKDLVELNKLVDEINRKVKEDEVGHLSELLILVDGDEAPLVKLGSIIKKLLDAKQEVHDKIEEQINSLRSKYVAIRDDAENKGLPLGSKDREAKKKELDDAGELLLIYREKVGEYKKLIAERRELFDKMVSACKKRTDLRVETAERITSQLSQDLDETILKVEASAQAMADKTDFINWLDVNLSICFKTYRSQRVSSLIDGGLVPEKLRDLLLGEDDDTEVLIREADKVTNGKVTEDDADFVVKSLSGVSSYDPEIQSPEDVNGDTYASLPAEIKDGLIYFPEKSKGGLLIDNVLVLDELVFNDLPVVRLNDRPNDAGSKPRPLEELSPGQRCSAVLPILLLNGRSPLIIDQPEDNLDNRLIRQVIVNVLGSIKLRRQVIVATHNPNIPVLGDAEQTIVLAAVDEKQAEIKGQGNLDDKGIVNAVTEIMEGGREAFQYRQSIYQTHWFGVIE